MRRLSIALLLVAVLAAGCAQATPAEPTAAQPAASGQAASLSGSISLAGSTTVQPLAEKLSEAFGTQYPQVKIDVQGGGSSVGVKSAGQGTVDVGMASREVKDSEMAEFADLIVHRIAVDGVAIVANSGVAINGLTSEQVQAIFAGEITSWSEVGGPDAPFTVVAREEGSGTRDFFQEHFMGADKAIVDTAILQPSNGALRTTVGTTPNSIGFLSFGYLDGSVKALDIDGVAATEANIRNETYSAWRYLNLLTRGEPSGLVKAWLDYIASPEGQDVVVSQGYLKLK